MEGVRQQAEQHLASAHADARSIIQKAQATAADLQVSFSVRIPCLVSSRVHTWELQAQSASRMTGAALFVLSALSRAGKHYKL